MNASQVVKCNESPLFTAPHLLLFALRKKLASVEAATDAVLQVRPLTSRNNTPARFMYDAVRFKTRFEDCGAVEPGLTQSGLDEAIRYLKPNKPLNRTVHDPSAIALH